MKTRPDPIGSDPVTLATWLRTVPFPYDDEEKELLATIVGKTYTGEPTAVADLYALRILYWQVVGWLRK